MSIYKLINENEEIINEIRGLEIETLYEHLRYESKREVSEYLDFLDKLIELYNKENSTLT